MYSPGVSSARYRCCTAILMTEINAVDAPRAIVPATMNFSVYRRIHSRMISLADMVHVDRVLRVH